MSVSIISQRENYVIIQEETFEKYSSAQNYIEALEAKNATQIVLLKNAKAKIEALQKELASYRIQT